MSTRGAIARVNGDGFKGVYHHWDSYPSGLGASLMNLYQGHFNRDLEKMLKELIDNHPAGWSTINDADFRLAPRYVEISKKDVTSDGKRGPECYCHGDRHEETQVVTEKNAADIGCEWVYAFNDKNQMVVLSSYNEDGKKMIGMFGMGNPDARWCVKAIIDLDGTEPDWENLGA